VWLSGPISEWGGFAGQGFADCSLELEGALRGDCKETWTMFCIVHRVLCAYDMADPTAPRHILGPRQEGLNLQTVFPNRGWDVVCGM